MRRRRIAWAVLVPVLSLPGPGIPRGYADGTAVTRAAATVPGRTPAADVRRAFEDGKFGLFVHWGLSTLIGKGEWVMEQDAIPIAEYEKLPPRFNPTGFDADRWVEAVAEAGQKTLTIAAKPHDGFCLFDTALTRYDVVDATPFARDPLRDLSDACRRHGVSLFFYYSLLDWHHPDYFPRGKTGRAAGRDDRGEWSRYVAYYQAQVRELCTRYGAIGGIVFDGCWDRPDADWDLEGTYRLVHALQPAALIANNHRGRPRAGEDFQIVELDRPVGDAFPRGTMPASPWVTFLTINSPDAPGSGEILGALLGAAGRGGNLFANVGARFDGSLGPEVGVGLRDVGRWLDDHGEAVYGTRPGPVPAQPWGVSVSKPAPGGGPLYLHVLRPELPIKLPRSFLAYDAFLEGRAELLNWIAAGDEVVIRLAEKDRAPVDTILVLRPGTRGH
jgi:alpha-L-fucosidase